MKRRQGGLILDLVIVLVAFSEMHTPFGAWFSLFLGNAVIAGAITWDLLVSEYRMGGAKAMEAAERTGRLFLYIGFMTWIAAQFLFAKTGMGTDVFLLEPMLGFGFIVFGLPAIFFVFIREYMSPDGEAAASESAMATAIDETH